MPSPANAGNEARNIAGAMTSMRIDELISHLAIGIANGQMELDKTCMDIARFMGEAEVAFGKKPNSDKPDKLSLIELGFTPNFYQFVDTILDVRVSIQTQYEETREYDSSKTNLHSDACESQSAYESQRSGSQSESSWGRNWGSSWGGWWSGNWGYSYGGSSGSKSSSYSNRSSGSSSYKRKNLSVNTVDARFASTYNYSVEGASSIKTKIVPIPPPEVFEEILRAKVQQRREQEQRDLWQEEARNTIITVHNTINQMQKTAKEWKITNIGNLEVLEKVREDIDATTALYDGLTTDHWAVIGNVGVRQKADESFTELQNGIQELINKVQPTDEGPVPEEMKGTLLEKFKDSLASCATAIASILSILNEMSENTPQNQQTQEPGPNEPNNNNEEGDDQNNT